MINPKLTKPQGEAQAAVQAATIPGMAHWAGTGPEGADCGSCMFWGMGPIKGIRYHGKPTAATRSRATRDEYRAALALADQIKPHTCGMYRVMTMGQLGESIPHDQPACRHFQPRHEGKPPLVRPPKEQRQKTVATRPAGE
jgi:hypothetical protein